MTPVAKHIRQRCGVHLDCIEACAVAFNVGIADLLGRSQSKPVLKARRAVVALLRNQKLSLPAIGRILGRHHTTVMNAERRAWVARCDDAAFGLVVHHLEIRFELEASIRREIPANTLPKYQEAAL